MKYTYPGGQTLDVIQADITEQQVDAIVNAANARLQHGAGVAGAIVRKGGAPIQRESNEWVKAHGPVAHDQPAWTGAGKLLCKWVIHAVGPMWQGGKEDEDGKLSAAINGSLVLAEKLGVKSLAIPPISTGIFKFPIDRAAGLFFNVITAYYQKVPASLIREMRIAIIDPETYTIFANEFKRWQEEG